MKAPATKRLVWFALLSALIYAVLALLAWPIVDSAYAGFFRSTAQAFFGERTHDVLIEFGQADDAKGNNDLFVRVGKRQPTGQGSARRAGLSSFHMGYLSTAFLVALTIATPLPWRRRAWALVIGLVLIQAFILLRAWLLIVNLGSMETIGLYHLGSWARRIFSVTFQLLVKSPEVKFLAPVIVCCW